jgi:hypothetical protein
MSDFPWKDLVWCFSGFLFMYILGWVRTFLAKRVKVQTVDAPEISRLSHAVRRQSFLLEAGIDRQAMHAQAIIVLANAVKTGDQSQITRSLDIMSASESQYLASLTARLTREDKTSGADDVEDI